VTIVVSGIKINPFRISHQLTGTLAYCLAAAYCAAVIAATTTAAAAVKSKRKVNQQYWKKNFIEQILNIIWY